jgi:hypothetical protein
LKFAISNEKQARKNKSPISVYVPKCKMGRVEKNEFNIKTAFSYQWKIIQHH